MPSNESSQKWRATVDLSLRERQPFAEREVHGGPSRLQELLPLRLILQPSGRALELNRPDMVLGRHSKADLRLPLPDVSRWHCRFLWADGSWQVIDLHSLNGLYVNDQLTTHATLHSGDTLRIGGFTFMAAFPAGAGSTAPFGQKNAGEVEVMRNIAGALPVATGEDHLRRRAS
jgi:predicted component of type VI protein secretion system